MPTLKWIIIYLALGYLFFILYAYFFSDKIIFLEPASSYQDDDTIIKIRTRDGALISAKYLPNPDARFTILYSHGNAADIGNLQHVLEEFHNHGFAVFTYDYEGYGTSTGRPSEQKTYEDVDAAYRYLTVTLKIPPNRIISYGQSLGAALAIDIASRKPVAGLIAESPFVTSFRTLTVLPIVPFDKFDNLSKIRLIEAPTLIIHGKKDHVIPFWHGKKLYENVNAPKQYLWLGDAGHNDPMFTDSDLFWKAINQFVQNLVIPASESR